MSEIVFHLSRIHLSMQGELLLHAQICFPFKILILYFYILTLDSLQAKRSIRKSVIF